MAGTSTEGRGDSGEISWMADPDEISRVILKVKQYDK
jgi:hypothetical protein